MTSIFILITFWLIAIELIQAEGNLKLFDQWKMMDFKFPNESARASALKTGNFVPGNSFILDVDVQYREGNKSRVFVTTPRFGPGRPLSLGVVTKGACASQSLVAPYPDYSWHANQGKNCEGITSAVRVAIDKCNRMWVIDSGGIGFTQTCPPQLLAFDLKTDKLILRHRLTHVVRPGTGFVTVEVDTRDAKCKDTFVYIADIGSYAIIVFDMSSGTSWRIQDQFTYPHPRYATFTILGQSFTIMDGVIALTLSPFKNKQDDRTLYFHSLASNTENIVKTSTLRNQTLWSDGQFRPSLFKELPGGRHSQAATEAIDKDGIMYFGLVSQNAIACWNTATPFLRENIHILVQDDETLQFAGGVKIVDNLKGEQELWIATNRIQKIFTGTMNNEEVNYRILTANVKDLVGGSKCAHPNVKDLAGDSKCARPNVKDIIGGSKCARPNESEGVSACAAV